MHDEQLELDEPVHVRQVESQFRHLGDGLREVNYFGSQAGTHVFREG